MQDEGQDLVLRIEIIRPGIIMLSSVELLFVPIRLHVRLVDFVYKVFLNRSTKGIKSATCLSGRKMERSRTILADK